MLQAFLVVPAFALVYLVAAPTPAADAAAAPGRRGRRDGGGVGLVGRDRRAVAGLVAALHRRLAGQQRAGAGVRLQRLRPADRQRGRVGRRRRPAGGGGWGETGISRLFNSSIGGQIAWLLPAALILLVAAFVARRAGAAHRPAARRGRCSGAAGWSSPAWRSASWPASSTSTTPSPWHRRSARWSASAPVSCGGAAPRSRPAGARGDGGGHGGVVVHAARPDAGLAPLAARGRRPGRRRRGARAAGSAWRGAGRGRRRRRSAWSPPCWGRRRTPSRRCRSRTPARSRARARRGRRPGGPGGMRGRGGPGGSGGPRPKAGTQGFQPPRDARPVATPRRRAGWRRWRGRPARRQHAERRADPAAAAGRGRLHVGRGDRRLAVGGRLPARDRRAGDGDRRLQRHRSRADARAVPAVGRRRRGALVRRPAAASAAAGAGRTAARRPAARSPRGWRRASPHRRSTASRSTTCRRARPRPRRNRRNRRKGGKVAGLSRTGETGAGTGPPRCSGESLSRPVCPVPSAAHGAGDVAGAAAALSAGWFRGAAAGGSGCPPPRRRRGSRTRRPTWAGRRTPVRTGRRGRPAEHLRRRRRCRCRDGGQPGGLVPPLGDRWGVRFGFRGRSARSRTLVGTCGDRPRPRARPGRRSREAGGVRRSSRTGGSACGWSGGVPGAIMVPPTGGGAPSAAAPGAASENVPDDGGPASVTNSVSTAAEPMPADRRWRRSQARGARAARASSRPARGPRPGRATSPGPAPTRPEGRASWVAGSGPAPAHVVTSVRPSAPQSG